MNAYSHQVTVTYKKGKATRSHTFTGIIMSPLCQEIRIGHDEQKLQSVAWVDVVSVTITRVRNGTS